MQVKRVALNIYADEESWTRTQANVQESKILILIFLKREMDQSVCDKPKKPDNDMFIYIVYKYIRYYQKYNRSKECHGEKN